MVKKTSVNKTNVNKTSINKTKKNRRDEKLIPFSHEHHTTLRVALKLKQEPTSQETKAFLDENRTMLLAHFKEEEALFIPLLPQIPNGGVLMRRFLEEHRDLRKLLEEAEVDDYPVLGEKLQAHTRFEERELFPAVEAYWASQTP